MLDMDHFAALSDPTRRAILELLARRGELPAGEIAAQFDISGPAVSQHLKALREAGLVRVERRAQQRIYRLNPEAMRELEQWAGHLRYVWERRLDSLEAFLRSEDEGKGHG
ncbi:MAG: winged helix-turn-helix transcriptional regulator [Candidatus Promineofilum sp.]|nr:winged helix-turn-helix transcriptional regulator [Promineifilum sp.]